MAGFGGFGGGNIQNLMKQAQKMQDEMQKNRAIIDESEFVGASGGNLVEVTLMGDKTMKKISIKKDAVDPDDIETLEDLIVSAFNLAISKIVEIEKEKLPQLPTGM